MNNMEMKEVSLKYWIRFKHWNEKNNGQIGQHVKVSSNGINVPYDNQRVMAGF